MRSFRLRFLFWAGCLAGLSLAVPGANVLLLNLDRDQPDTGPDPHSSTTALQALLGDLGYGFDYLEVGLTDHSTLATIDYGRYELVFVCVGVNCLFQHAHRFTPAEGQPLVAYLQSGGNVYLEGGDVWVGDPQIHGAFNFCPAFQVTPIEDGAVSDLYRIKGVKYSTPSTNNKNFLYTGDNCFMDKITNVTGYSSKIWENWTNADTPVIRNVAVAFAGTYKTVASAFEFGGIGDGTGNINQSEVLRLYLDFFGVEPEVDYGNVDGLPGVTVHDLQVLAAYLAENLLALGVPLEQADLNADGVVDIRDLNILDQFLAGNIDVLPHAG